MWYLTAVEWALQALRLIATAIIGGNIGSFLNVVAWRVPRAESIVFGRSHCPFCGHLVRAHDNVPVLGWLQLRGRCRDCHAPISVRYPVVEATCATVALVLVTVDASAPMALLQHGVLFTLLMVVTLLERDDSRMPAELPSMALVFAIVGAAFFPETILLRPDWPMTGGSEAFARLGMQGHSWNGLPDAFAKMLAASLGAFAGWVLSVASDHKSDAQPAGAFVALTDVHNVFQMPSALALPLIGAFLGWQAVLATIVIAWPARCIRLHVVAGLRMTPSTGWSGDFLAVALALVSGWRAAGG